MGMRDNAGGGNKMSCVSALATKYGLPSMRSTDLYQPNPNNPAKLVWAYSGGEQVPRAICRRGKGPVAHCRLVDTIHPA